MPILTTNAQGMGFGLAICKRIVEAHGGKITVDNKIGKGTAFTVTFPIEQQLIVQDAKQTVAQEAFFLKAK